MPIYEYYCPQNNTIYQFFAKTLAQGGSVPSCPDNSSYAMEKIVSSFAITGAQKKSKEGQAGDEAGAEGAPLSEGEADDPRMEAAMQAMEGEFASIDENDPKAMARMMRRMSELTGERIDGEMEEVVRKLEEGTDPEKLEEQLGGSEGADESGEQGDPYGMGGGSQGALGAAPKEAKFRYKKRRSVPYRDPKLYDY